MSNFCPRRGEGKGGGRRKTEEKKEGVEGRIKPISCGEQIEFQSQCWMVESWLAEFRLLCGLKSETKRREGGKVSGLRDATKYNEISGKRCVEYYIICY